MGRKKTREQEDIQKEKDSKAKKDPHSKKEDQSTKEQNGGFSLEAIKNAGLRLLAVAFSRMVSRNERKTRVSEGLDEEHVEDLCFKALGYLEELYQLESSDVINIRRQDSNSLLELEKKLDIFLSDNKVADKKNKTDKLLKTKKYIKEELNKIVRNSQVRQKFQEEFQQEYDFYQLARPFLKEVRDIDRLTTKINMAIYKLYLKSMIEKGKLLQSFKDQIAVLEQKNEELAIRKLEIYENASVHTLGFLKMQELLQYKQQLNQTGFVLTPSRLELIDRISSEAVSGKKIFLVGSTGTGKTQLAVYVLDSMAGGFELIPWHEGTTPRDIFGYREIYEDKNGKVKSGVVEGPYPKALRTKKGLLNEEFTGGTTRVHLAYKFFWGLKPGDIAPIPGLEAFAYNISHNFLEIFTGNPKDEKTKNREDMDPAVLRELTGVHVEYFPAKEMAEIITAMLINEYGVLRFTKSELNFLKKLCNAAMIMQKMHNREFDDFSEDLKKILLVDEHGFSDFTLNNNFLDPGTLFKLFSEWPLLSAKGYDFRQYMTRKLREFVEDPKTLGHMEERKILRNILHKFGVITSSNGPIEALVNNNPKEKRYILPSQMSIESGQNDVDPMAGVDPVEKPKNYGL